MTFSVKEGAQIYRMHPAIVTAWPTIMQVMHRHGYDTTITEGNDTINRKHRSYHKTMPCRAVDLRTWANVHGIQMTDAQKQAICDDLNAELPEGFQAMYGPFNIHVEFEG